ncbi:MAG: NAD(P)-dependent glycerol-3-phosphate dehydrogenase [Dehalococcoidia bacterium]|nr:NAD(P)-dependent glycerol-3-phosphate dehydrogenase [Dehalococcoidia bacterium]
MAIVTAVGATSWGTTLGIILAREGHEVRLLARTEEEAASIESARENARFVPGVQFPESMHALADPVEAHDSADLTIFAVPSQTLRTNARAVAHAIPNSTVVVNAAKGLELSSVKRMSEVINEEILSLDHGVCALSGPNLAREIIRSMPASTVVASNDPAAATEAQTIINSSTFRVYTNDDLVGVELAGALKNIIALGAGMCDGMGFGDNTKATFITRGLAEIARLGVAAGANPATFAGLAGMGDLVATCMSTLSRNHYFGTQIASGKTLEQVRSDMDSVAEGVDTTRAALDLAESLGVEMPIAQATNSVLFGGVSVPQAVQNLMGREPRAE